MSKEIHFPLQNGLRSDSWPRELGFAPVADPDSFRRPTHGSLVELVDHAEYLNGSGPVYMSVYGYPNGGKPADGHPPQADCLFIDFDIEDQDGEWADEIAPLLSAVGQVARRLVQTGKAKYWRAALSGHKGVHLYLDFPPIERHYNLPEVKAGLLQLLDDIVESWDDVADFGISQYVDVSSEDGSRMARIPNTKHPTATFELDRPCYCVPVEMNELISLTPEKYAELTSEPRLYDGVWERTESGNAHAAVSQAAFANVGTEPTSGASKLRTSRFDGSRVVEYQKTHGMTGEDPRLVYNPKAGSLERAHGDSLPGNFEEYNDPAIPFEHVWSRINKPCIKAYYLLEEKFDHQYASHRMELFVVQTMVEAAIPYEHIVRVFKSDPRFNVPDTTRMLNNVIAREYDDMNCRTLIDDAGMYCLADDCGIYRTNEDLQK